MAQSAIGMSVISARRRTIAAAYVLDVLFGDPAGWPHPVRAFGAIIAGAERRYNDRTPAARASGAAVAALLTAATFASTALFLAALKRRAPRTEIAVAAILGATTLATTDLLREATGVVHALEANDIEIARTRVARIVGRDTTRLNDQEIARAVIETLAESAADGIVAPLFWLAAGGVPAALAFKMVSTMDSMIGHRDERYRYFGTAAARLDDLMNFAPARITASLIALVCRAPVRALRVALRDARAHASPNAGWPEAAMAAALGVRLGGDNRYDDIVITGPLFYSAGRTAQLSDVRAAMALVRRVSLLAALGALALRA
ncbi:MAG: adenosylcobinamide-phosphate synthase CbiB [Candidatus Velthaea sp.]